ncbi:membrane protein insertase YidC [Thioalkalicoccus limnaeus]|uniref:Membrane protein insertase YidC n=1 Tax=Thioalkalicoccus limnaeus TaxID=120681 RepID=A0ABV4BDY9_9GAMM
MDNYRLILILSLGLVLFMIYQAWVKDYGQIASPPSEELTLIDSIGDPEPTPTAAPEGVPMAATVPDTARPTVSADSEQATDLSSAHAPITVDTDVLRLEISPKGGTIISAWLKDYEVHPDRPEEKVRLLKPQPPNLFLAQAGLLSATPDQAPNHEALFRASRSHYELGDADELVIELLWESNDGVEVIKRYRIERGSYLVHVSHEVRNNTAESIAVRRYSQLQRTELYDPDASWFLHTYTGGVFYSPEDKYNRVSFSNMQNRPLDKPVIDGWIAMIQHYFLAAWIPPSDTQYNFYTNVIGNDRYIIGMYSPAIAIPPGMVQSFEDRLFVGPKLQEVLVDVAPGLRLAVDYGWLTILAQPIFWLLNKIYGLVGNWGWAIVILTVLIKLLFYKLSETSYKSMAGMRKLTPRLQALKDRYGDDKERLNQAMMELYKKEKINPLGGCLPILIQIPVFIALYWVLIESVELRHASFIFWLNNLSAPDPYYVLPLIMGASMFLQTKLNPTPPDPIQAKIMISLPFVFTVFFAFFPAGLVLYWTVNNILSIAQQWYITHQMEKQEKKK